MQKREGPPVVNLGLLETELGKQL